MEHLHSDDAYDQLGNIHTAAPIAGAERAVEGLPPAVRRRLTMALTVMKVIGYK